MQCVWRPAPSFLEKVGPSLSFEARSDLPLDGGGGLKRWDMSRVAREEGYEPPMDLIDPGQVVVTVAYDESQDGGYAPMRLPGVAGGYGGEDAVVLGGKGFANLVGVSNAALTYAAGRGFGYVFPKLVQTEGVHPMPDGTRREDEWGDAFGVDACHEALRVAWGLDRAVPAVKRGRPWTGGGGRAEMGRWSCPRESNATQCLGRLRGDGGGEGRLIFVAADQCYRAKNRRALCWPHQLVWRWPFWLRPPHDRMQNVLQPGVLHESDAIVVVVSERRIRWHFDTSLSGAPLRDRFRALSPRTHAALQPSLHATPLHHPAVRVVMHQRLGDIVGMFRKGWHRANAERRPLRLAAPNPNRVTKYVPPSYFVASVRALLDVVHPTCLDVVILTDAALEVNDPRHPGVEDVQAVLTGLRSLTPIRVSWNGRSLEGAQEGGGMMRVSVYGGDSQEHGPRATFTAMTGADVLVCGGSGFSRLAAVLADAASVKIAPHAPSHPMGLVPGVVELPRQGPRQILEGRAGGDDPLGIESGWWEAALGAPGVKAQLRALVHARLGAGGLPAQCRLGSAKL